MTGLNPTGPRLALMRAIVEQPGSVTYRRNWGRDPDEVIWQYAAGGRKTVTGVYNQLDAAGLVKRGPATHASMYAPRPVEPTTEGLAWLAEHDKETTR